MFHPTAAPDAVPASVVYEQPLTERLRAFLRLEFLWQQAMYHAGTPTALSGRAAVASLLEILAITARGDARGDVLKELERQMAVLREYQNRQGVDVARLRAILTGLERRRADLNGAGNNFMQPLRDSEFLSAIKHRSAIPGGTCEFDLPDYYHWLNSPAEQRENELNSWLNTIRPLCEAVSELLWVTRENARPRRETATGGVYQVSFDREILVQLLRITLPGDSRLYPVVSGSQHRCTVRFLDWTGAGSRPAQTTEDVPFVLTCCS